MIILANNGYKTTHPFECDAFTMLGYEGELEYNNTLKRFLKSNNIHPLELTSSDPDIQPYKTK